MCLQPKAKELRTYPPKEVKHVSEEAKVFAEKMAQLPEEQQKQVMAVVYGMELASEANKTAARPA